MNDSSVIIIGAGVAGLAVGCYAQMNGYRTRILEMHSLPGGLCTAWRREGYTIDGCIQWLVGTAPSSPYHRIWEELGAVQGRSVLYPPTVMQVEHADGSAVSFFADVDRLERHLIDVSPEDADLIREYTAGVRFAERLDTPIDKAPELYGLVDALRMLKLLPNYSRVARWAKMPAGELASSFKSPVLRDSFFALWQPDASALSLLLTMHWLYRGLAGYPLGGSLPFAKAIERRYRDLGGEVQYGARVTKILVEGGRAVGVSLEDGSEQRADSVISAADGHTTLVEMLDGQPFHGEYTSKRLRACYGRLRPYDPLVYVGLGVAHAPEAPPEDAPLDGSLEAAMVELSVMGVSLPLPEPLQVAGRPVERVRVRVHTYDPSLAPPGKACLTVSFPSDYDAWADLAQDPGAYRAEKRRLTEELVAGLEGRFPGLAQGLEMWDVATPLTFQRYTGNWRGSFQGWLATPETLSMRVPKELPGLERFQMAGHWLEPGGGLSAAALSGRNAVQILCKRDGKAFETSVP